MKKLICLLMVVFMTLICASSLTSCGDPPPELPGAKTYRYDFNIHGKELAYVLEVPATQYEGELLVCDLYIEQKDGKRLNIGACTLSEGQTDMDFGILKFKLGDTLEFDSFGESTGFNYISGESTTHIASFEMIAGVYTRKGMNGIADSAGNDSIKLFLNEDGTANLAGKIDGVYYPIGISEIIFIDNESNNGLYIKLDDKVTEFDANRLGSGVFGTVQISNYYDFCLTDPAEVKRYLGDFRSHSDGGCLQIDDKYFRLSNHDGDFAFGEYTRTGNTLYLTIVNKFRGEEFTETLVLTVNDTELTFSLA